MTDSATLIVVTAIAAVPSTCVGLLNVWTARGHANALEKVHLATNSMKDALVKSVGELMYAKGVKDESERAKGTTQVDNPPQSSDNAS